MAAPLVSAARVKAVGRLSDRPTVCLSVCLLSLSHLRAVSIPAFHVRYAANFSIRPRVGIPRVFLPLCSFSSFPSIWIDRYTGLVEAHHEV